MAKTIRWRIRMEDGTDHVVTYTQNRFTGRVTVTLNEDIYLLSAGFLSLKSARREPFRVVSSEGEAEQALLTVDKRGKPALIYGGREVPQEC